MLHKSSLRSSYYQHGFSRISLQSAASPKSNTKVYTLFPPLHCFAGAGWQHFITQFPSNTLPTQHKGYWLDSRVSSSEWWPETSDVFLFKSWTDGAQTLICIPPAPQPHSPDVIRPKTEIKMGSRERTNLWEPGGNFPGWTRVEQ